MNNPALAQQETQAVGVTVRDETYTQAVSLAEPATSKTTGPKFLDGNLSLISGVKVKLEFVVGEAELTIAELFALQQGSIVPLKQLHNEPITVRLDGKPIANGVLVVVGDNFGVRITEIPAVAQTETP